MAADYQISYEGSPEEEAWGIIGRGVGGYNKDQVGYNDFQRLCFVLKSDDGTVVGGVLGETYWEWLYIDLLWVREELRRQGYGRKLMEKAEEEGRKRGARHAHLDTFTFQTPAFYESIGYERFGTLEDFPPGHTRFFMRKEL
jgi:GNAT superfamily N-acetyltransferase